MPKVFVTRKMPDAGLKLMKEQGFKVTVYPEDKPVPRSVLLDAAKNSDALVTILTDKIDESVFKAGAGTLKVIANYAVGFDNIDLAAAKKYGVVVTNTPAEEVSETVAEHAFALMIGLAHRLVESDAYARAGKYKGWSPLLLLGSDLHDKTLGIVGMGRIGAALAERAVKGFHMKVVYADPRKNPAFEKEYGAEHLPIEKLLAVSDYVSLHVPLLPSTRHLLSTVEFSLMKKTACVINTARGPVIDEKALLRALRTKRIAGAGLDVFENEPAIDADLTDKLELKSFPNVILTPHTASATIEARQAMSLLAGQNVVAVLSGKAPITPVPLDVKK